jgi:hypothetical protein
MRFGLGLSVACALVGCGPAVVVPGDGDPGETEGGPTGSSTNDSASPTSSPSSTGVPPSTTAGTTGVDPTDDGSGSSETTSVTTASGFIVDDFPGECICECSVWDQDCLEGDKCMPWANDGGNSWNAVRCVPIDPDPAAPGEPCVAQESGVSGLDNCALGSMCWDVDPETLEGTCVAFCTGSEDAPLCTNPNTTCTISNEGVLILCLPLCDPLVNDCEGDDICRHQSGLDWICLPPGGDMAAYGEPCSNTYDCGAGLHCAPSMQMQGIGTCSLAEPGCCTHLCDTSEGDADCPDTGLGQTCELYYTPEQDPFGKHTLGTCVIE